ncbi:hypothetical protein HMH01_15160 [Halovulum dunhuangense]|uniref:Uncharacterized protein n=1 Tax=Halovulum dunhuangense TaxID=1505036 RepID=A0A849L5N1_9RHOB|nr:hypothetical protein [Halovulum dunhuangense]NNU81778.1 hypothetical protein [Halovulum dunhuangense]
MALHFFPDPAPAPNSVEEEIERRHMEFVDGFGNDGFFEEALVVSLKQISRICTVYFGEETANAGLDLMVGRYFSDNVAKGGWEYALEEEYSGIYSELPIGHLFHDLDAYANYGIVLTPARDVETRERILRRDVQKAEEFIEAIPLEAWGIDNEHALRLVRKASARLKLDLGQPVKAEDLALLSGLALQSIKNRLSGRSKEINGNRNRIDAHEALAWLSTREEFLPSLWREQDDTSKIEFLDGDMEGALFVPVATDGSRFEPDMHKDGFYYVGNEGHERRFEDYDEALEALQNMMVPVWRRPIEGGNWTRVRGRSWDRVPCECLRKA